MWRWKTSQSGINFGQAVGGATGVLGIASQKQRDASCVMRMVGKEHRNKNRCVQKDRHSVPSKRREIAFPTDGVQSIIDDGGIQRLAGAKDRNPVFLDPYP